MTTDDFLAAFLLLIGLQLLAVCLLVAILVLMK